VSAAKDHHPRERKNVNLENQNYLQSKKNGGIAKGRETHCSQTKDRFRPGFSV